jgi:hypothetical protein
MRSPVLGVLLLLFSAGSLASQVDGVYVGSHPTAVLTTPTANGLRPGEAFVSAGMLQRQRYHRNPDGAVFGGFGLGDPHRYVGLDVTLTSFSTFKRGFFSRTTASFKIHRVLADGWRVAAGRENLLVRGRNYAGESSYVVLTRGWEFAEATAITGVSGTAGIGSDRFRSEKDWESGARTIGPFLSVDVATPPISWSVEWSQDLSIGAAIQPIHAVPVRATIAALDVWGRAGDGVRAAAAVEMSVRLLR